MKLNRFVPLDHENANNVTWLRTDNKKPAEAGFLLSVNR
jgi:hypothetical protein